MQRALGVSLALAVVVVLTAGISVAGASTQEASVVTLRPSLDGTVIDSDNDGGGDWVYDELGSVVVGYGHPALGPGEDRGVLEFALPSVNAPRACIASATLSLSVAGTNGDASPNYRLFAGVADGSLAASDYGGTSKDRAVRASNEYSLVLDGTMSADVTNEVRLATLMTRTSDVSGVRFVLRQAQVSIGVAQSILVGTNELEDTYGPEYTRAARLTIVYSC